MTKAFVSSLTIVKSNGYNVVESLSNQGIKFKFSTAVNDNNFPIFLRGSWILSSDPEIDGFEVRQTL